MLRRQQLQLTTSTSNANAWLQVAVTKHKDNKLAHASSLLQHKASRLNQNDLSGEVSHPSFMASQIACRTCTSTFTDMELPIMRPS